MELKELSEKVLDLFGIENISLLKDKLMDVVLKSKTETMEKFCELVDGDLTVDWLQMIFQYYEADRKEKMQDYTPKSLAKLVARLSGADSNVIDMCAGSGALTIQRWNERKNAEFTLYEFDENVIPYLLFNLAIRNIKGNVYHKDVLSGEIFASYRLTPRERFSEVDIW